ncbi:hypothetical protein, partial [Clostridium aminobutyricum]
SLGQKGNAIGSDSLRSLLSVLPCQASLGQKGNAVSIIAFIISLNFMIEKIPSFYLSAYTCEPNFFHDILKALD